ncbi:MAG: DNRLRE domain-containing protein [Bacteroidota bacterium]|nr:DNRLRE domain-containing protein [Bacteroidota bacterium]
MSKILRKNMVALVTMIFCATITMKAQVLSDPISQVHVDNYLVKLSAPSGYRIPKIIGASGQISSNPSAFTNPDYFQWYGITHHRYWFKPTFSRLNWKGGVKTIQEFLTASQLIRQNPLKQGTRNDVFIDWSDFTSQCKGIVCSDIEKMLSIGVIPMLVNTSSFSNLPISDWGDKFEYWKYWYTYVYFFASHYDITLYQFTNEPHAGISYDTWKSRWLICTDATHKAITDVNRDFNKHLISGLNGPTEPGPYWDYSLPDPNINFHGWGSVSWADIHTDIEGKQDSTIWNYDLYDFHKYSNDGLGYENTIRALRQGIANARKAPSPNIPIMISEINTSTGGNFKTKNLDNEDLNYGISVAQILQATAIGGPAGLGTEGGLFLFKLGAAPEGTTLGNKISYVSPISPFNYGGITRGGACFQMYARHFRGGLPLLSLTEISGSNAKRRSVAVLDDAENAYYFYSSFMSGVDAKVSLDLSALAVKVGSPVTMQRVDINNIGQITEILSIDNTKKVSFSIPNNTAFLVRIPRTLATVSTKVLDPIQDTYLTIGSQVDHSSEGTIKVSLHHADPLLRRIGFLNFSLKDINSTTRVLLKLSGRNTGDEANQREIIHVYGVVGNWKGQNLKWSNAPGIGKYYSSDSLLQTTTGLGSMVEIEDNYSGVTPGQGLGIYGKFLGQISFSSSSFKQNYLDVTDYVRSLLLHSTNNTVTFVLARIVRYNVNQYSSSYYRKGVYDYDNRCVEFGSSENPDSSLRPKLCLYH